MAEWLSHFPQTTVQFQRHCEDLKKDEYGGFKLKIKVDKVVNQVMCWTVIE